MRARLVLLLIVLGTVPRAFATTAADLCAPAADPCVVPQGTAVAVSNGSVIDLGDRALVLASGSGTRLDAGAGTMSIIARSVTLNPGSALLGRTINVTTTTGNISVLRAGTARARIDVAEFLVPGTIVLDAGGAIEIQGIATAQGTGADGGNGTIAFMAGGDVTVSGEVNASGGGNAIGGDVFVQSLGGDFLMSGFIDVTAGTGGGTIEIAVAGSVNTVLLGPARLDAKADGAEGDGGSVDIVAMNGDVVVAVPIEAGGTAGIDFGGSGGDVTIEATHGTVTLSHAISMSGGTPDGDGGDLDVFAGLDVVHTGSVTALGRDQTGVGGAADFFGERAVTVGSIDVGGTCLDCAGGDVSAIGWCSVTVPTGSSVLAKGAGGGVLIRSGGDVDVHGRIEAGHSITIVYRNAANPPDLSGAVLVPTPTQTADTRLIPCGGPVGASCGNGSTDVGETCDDGNTLSCDGCSSACLVEACGDGRVGCNAQHQVEVCDDGNTIACDGCNATCTRRDAVCGDGTQECDEQCDTGAAIDCDDGACSAQCEVEVCGNGRAECFEQCDEGGASETCSDTCVLVTPATCGDGVEDANEGCDDGNTDDCDGCSRFCQVEGCGNGVTECAEGCDDFNTDSCDSCSATCQIETCGNDVVDCGEECDLGDENGTPGSNCLDCRFAPTCSAGGPDACIPCGDVFDCDPLGRCAGTDCMEGICTPDPIDCTSDDPCEVGTCDAANGCVFTPVQGFDSVRCRLDDLGDMLTGDGVSDKARTKLGKLLASAGAKVDAAEDALEAGKQKPVGKALAKARGKVVRFGKKVVSLQPKQITNPDLGARLSERSSDARGRIETLRGGLGF